MRRALIFALVLGASLHGAAASALAAGTVTRSLATSGSISYTGSGAANITVTDAPVAGGIALTIAETGISVGVPAGGCVDNGNTVTCQTPPNEEVILNGVLDTGNDDVDASGVSRSTIIFQDLGGSDEMTGGNATADFEGDPIGDVLRGNDGVDKIFGGAGNDDVSLGTAGGEIGEGGPGNDQVSNSGGEPIADVMRGGPGTDTVWAGSTDFQLINFTIDLRAGTIAEPGMQTDVAEGFENVLTPRGGNDTLLGTDGPNTFEAGPGNDTVVGRLGADNLKGEGGNDRLEARDGVVDRAFGGVGTDTCVLDQLDAQSACESSLIATVSPFGAILQDIDPPGCVLRGLTRRALSARRVARSGLVFTADCDEPGRVAAKLVGTLRRGKRTRLARTGDIELVSRRAKLGRGDRVKLRLKPSRRLRKLLRRKVRLRLEVRATDAAGNNTRLRAKRLRLR